MTNSVLGFAAVAVFIVAYGIVIAEELTGLRKSVPVVVAAGLMWIIVAAAWHSNGVSGAEIRLREILLEFGELLLFLLSAMTFVNTLQERDVFAALRAALVARGFSLRTMFWLTGFMAFWLSSVLDNLTTALVMGAVAIAIGRESRTFVVLSCINVVVAANAGGAFCPFGDITTLMVWQKGVLGFFDFFNLLGPALINWVVPAFCMSFAVPRARPAPESVRVTMKRGGPAVIALFAFTIVLTVSLHQALHLPPVVGMMTGLGLLFVLGFYLRHEIDMKQVDWDTLLFFYGVILCVGALGALGYLALLSELSYVELGPTVANVLVGITSAVIDNIPLMYAVLSVNPAMSDGQWLLVTLTAGVGGSLLSIGSAAGVALMGQARGVYTFSAHLRWSWAIALGYAASVGAHLLINSRLF